MTKKRRSMMRRLLLLGIFLVSCTGLTSCVRIHSVSVSDLDPTATTTITAKAQGVGILHLIVPTCAELEDRVVQELGRQRATKNVRIRMQMRDFLFAVQLYEVMGSAER